MMLLPFFSGSVATVNQKPPLKFYNTLSKEKEVFIPLKEDFVRLYHCGPTVYDFAHIGNLRAYVFADTIRRALRYNGYKVKQVMNFTDIGHLTSDADLGDDKMVNAIKREGEEMTLEGLKRVADTYIAAFLEDIDALNILRPQEMPRPSEYIPQQIALIQTLVEKEYAYETSDGVYFDTKRFSGYGKLGNIDLTGLQEGARVAENHEKRNATDFVLWKKSGADIGWESPWGHGFPGWHIECSAMAMNILGKTIDIHTGGIDHIPVHHNNEIAQSEAATGKPFARIWMHSEHLSVDDTKISKSLGNTIYLRHIIERGHSALTYRYWLLTSHYRSPSSFSWSALEASEQALIRLHRYFFEELGTVKPGEIDPVFKEQFLLAINDDLNTAKALALVWELIKNPDITRESKKASLLEADKVLAIGLKRDEGSKVQVSITPEVIPLSALPEDIRLLVIAREEMREQKNWEKSDELRAELQSKGYLVEDGTEGPTITENKTSE